MNDVVILLLVFFAGLGVERLRRRLVHGPRPRWEEYTTVTAYRAVDRIRVTLGDEKEWRGPNALLDPEAAQVLREQLTRAIDSIQRITGGTS